MIIQDSHSSQTLINWVWSSVKPYLLELTWVMESISWNCFNDRNANLMLWVLLHDSTFSQQIRHYTTSYTLLRVYGVYEYHIIAWWCERHKSLIFRCNNRKYHLWYFSMWIKRMRLETNKIHSYIQWRVEIHLVCWMKPRIRWKPKILPLLSIQLIIFCIMSRAIQNLIFSQQMRHHTAPHSISERILSV